MKRNINVEAEGSELILKNKAGDYVIIPKKYRTEVQDLINKNCHSCIDSLVSKLPVMADYAEDGSVYPEDEEGNPMREETYTEWGERVKKIAPNLDYTKDDGTYNYRGAYRAGLEPEYDEKDKRYHLGSRDPYTGEILKSENHPTFKKSVEEDMKMGYETYRGKDGKIYSHDKEYLDKNRNKVKEYLGTYQGEVLPEVEVSSLRKGREIPRESTYQKPAIIGFEEDRYKKQEFKADNRSPLQKKIQEEYTDKVMNPSVGQQVREGVQNLFARYPANPLKIAGDLANVVAPDSKLAQKLPNTSNDRLENRRRNFNPTTSKTEKLKGSFEEGLGYTVDTAKNIGLAELGFLLPQRLVSPALVGMFRSGSRSNFASDLIELSQTDFDKLAEGDIEAIAELVLNGSSLVSKGGANFDASTLQNNIKNWKNISASDRKDTLKDIFNLGSAIYQQGQRMGNEE